MRMLLDWWLGNKPPTDITQWHRWEVVLPKRLIDGSRSAMDAALERRKVGDRFEYRERKDEETELQKVWNSAW